MSSGKNSLNWVRVSETYGVKNEDTPTCSTYRAKVPGGWLVAVWSGPTNARKNKNTNLQTFGGGLTFVPDAKDEWKLDPDEEQ